MILKRPAKRRFKYIYYDDVREQINVRSDVFTMHEAPPGIDFWGMTSGRGPSDSEEHRTTECMSGREIVECDDSYRITISRADVYGHPDHHPGREESPYTNDSNRWTEEDWLHYEQTQNEV